VTVKQFLQLKKLMQLATSPVDAEALGALRKANAILAAAGVDWQRVFERCVTVTHEVEAAPDEWPDAERIAQAFAVVEESAKGNFAEFVASLRAQWGEKGWLSPAQKEALFKAEARTRR
jgi:hypothetical protein